MRDEVINEEKFIFEDLRVYHRALQLAVELTKIATKLPHSYSRIRDQLIGAVISIPLNLAEGSGRLGEKDKKNFYKFSRSSAFELIPIIDIIYQLELINKEKRNNIRREVVELSRIISALIKKSS
ncbi:MAG: four helix bundle protein [Candidatus Liptonbacteria bacterium]|nr:four helix bundle protein [Candidatus Liptonbacteria bacterium]